MKTLKNILATVSVVVFMLLAFVRCSNWTEVEALQYERSLTESSHGDANSAYYRNLRAYKASKNHTICFGWFSDWTGTGSGLGGKLMGMPDSIDFVSMWGNWYGLSEDKKEDLRRVQEIKGTRVLMCFIVDNIGVQTTPAEVRNDWIVDGVQYPSFEDAMRAYWGWYSRGSLYDAPVDAADSAAMDAAIRKYAHSIIDTIDKYHWDGFDMDLEPGYGHMGNISQHPYRVNIFIDELSKYMGPASGTNRLLAVDGEPYYLSQETAPKVDYYLLQAYGDQNYSTTDNRLNRLFNAFEPTMTREEIVSRTVLTSNFESYASTGGAASKDWRDQNKMIYYTKRDGTEDKQIYAYATYTYPGVEARIGGFGAFRFGFDYSNGNNYGYMRQGIQLANPAVEIE